MTVIYYEAVPVALLDDRDRVTVCYDPSWIQRPAAFPGVIATSSEKRQGVDDLREAILRAVSG